MPEFASIQCAGKPIGCPGSGIKVFSFLKEYFLHWLEAMSSMRLASQTVGTIDALRSKSGVSRYLNCHLIATHILSGKHMYRIGMLLTGCQPIYLETLSNYQKRPTLNLLFWSRLCLS
ncbi:hypothetical protein BDV19DRAFT_374911 [Aspergillus venezuelensis]